MYPLYINVTNTGGNLIVLKNNNKNTKYYNSNHFIPRYIIVMFCILYTALLKQIFAFTF